MVYSFNDERCQNAPWTHKGSNRSEMNIGLKPNKLTQRTTYLTTQARHLKP